MTIENKREMTEVVVNGIMSFLPTDPLQIILASEAVGHHLEFLDAMRELKSGTLKPHETARARASAIAQSRIVLAMVRECRIVRKERLTLMAADREAARAAAEAKPEASAPTSASVPTTSSAPDTSRAQVAPPATAESPMPLDSRSAASPPAEHSPRNGTNHPKSNVSPPMPRIIGNDALQQAMTDLQTAVYEKSAGSLLRAKVHDPTW